ncbi:hypothetical protein IFM89_005069 [Coptis chinensis]|uniref:Uncharacterized protein n=1 Tax=Coptis chinensis TaxID=261450 RepID=A0A835HGL7_9MAGN|nr:hypothetical protein IFM89_005069 [Coptis chinensis]
MAKLFSFLTSFVLLLLANYHLLAAEARVLNVLKPVRVSSANVIESFVDGFPLGAIKTSGPSPGIGHHKSINAQALGDIKDSGPSPGTGHKFADVEALGGVKVSGPSPGAGHKFSNPAKTLGSVKAGPSPGTGHKYVTNMHQ